MEQGDDREQATVTKMLGFYQSAFAALPAIAHFGGLVERAVHIADEDAASNARNVRTKEKNDRLSIIQPLYWNALDESAATGKPLHFGNFFGAVMDALKLAGLKEIGDRQLRRDISTLQTKARLGIPRS